MSASLAVDDQDPFEKTVPLGRRAGAVGVGAEDKFEKTIPLDRGDGVLGFGAEDKTVVSPHSRIGRSLPGRTLGSIEIGGDSVPARQVGRYQILGKLGEGAMATVYRAFDPTIGRPLVIKFLHLDLCADAEYRLRFLREAKAAGMLSHPNIVTVFDVGEIDDRPYIAMELLDGGPLGDQFKESAGLPVRDVVRIGIQVADALDYAHGRGIVHRDIKPNNLLQLNDGATIKVADFGIAHMGGFEVSDHTRVGTVIGTPRYMSPEQATGQKVDGRSDLFSTGVVLYQLLTGGRPFEADSMVALVNRIATEEPPPIDRLRKGVPPALRRIIERCLRKQPDKRYQTGKELADGLRKVQRDLDAEADRHGQPRRVPLKLKLALGMAAVVAATMTITSFFVTRQQYATMLDQAIDNGASMTKMIAAESAVPALSDDWVGIDVFVQEIGRSLQLRSVAVSDRANQVRVSTNVADVDGPMPPITGESIPAGGRGIEVTRTRGPTDNEPEFSFEAPITFQGKSLGKVRMAVSEAPLNAAARQSFLLLGLLMAVTAAAVGLATYLLVERYSKPLQLLRDSLGEIGQGRLGYRIAEKRGDEFGEVFTAFDAMAETLEKSSRSAPASPTEALPSTTVARS